MSESNYRGVAVDAVFDSVSVATTHQTLLEESGVIFLFVFRGRAEASGPGEEIPWNRSAVYRQFLCYT